MAMTFIDTLPWPLIIGTVIVVLLGIAYALDEWIESELDE